MRESGRLMLVTGIVLFVFMLTSLVLMSDALQNSNRFGEVYSALFLFNAIGLLAMIVLIAMNLRRLIRQLRNKIAGAKLTFRMVAVFSLLSVTPVLILYYFSLDFLHNGIDSWFDIRVEEALDDSLELGRLSLEMRMKELSRQTEQIAVEFSRINNAVIPFEIDEYRERSSAEELILMNRQGTIIASSVSDPTNLVPNRPDETILFQLQQGTNYIGLDTTLDAGLLIRVVVNVPQFGVESETRILQALFPVTERINELSGNVQSAYVKYQELSYLKEELKQVFIITLTLVLLFSIFSVVWAAFYSAQSLTAPITDLAKGTRSVAEGNYNTQLTVPSHDELGFLVASFNDMTRRIAQARDEVRESQQEAEAQRTYLEVVLSRLSSGVLVIDQQKQLRTANISSGKILGVKVENLAGANLVALTGKFTYLEQLLKAIDYHVENSDDWREQITLFGTSGRQVLMCSGTSVTDADAEDIVHVVVFDDITALVQGQRDAAWSEMARRLAHEIKNPLTPIKLAAERLRHKYLKVLPDSQLETLDKLTTTIISQVETMKDMVNAFSDYARKPEMVTEDVNINTLLNEVVDLYGNLDPNARINMELDTEIPFIKADPGRLRQVFNNILNNAFEASGSDSETVLNISTHFVSDGEIDCIEVKIKDSGPGLSKDIMSSIFEPYVTTKKKGTGLGLAIVKKIIDEHGGMVLVENNNSGHGACAIIRLPVSSQHVDYLPTRLEKDAI